MLYKCLYCNRKYQKKVEIKKRFCKTYKFSNNDIKFIFLLLEKGVFSHEHMDNWKKFRERRFLTHLNIKGITDTDYAHSKRLFKDFEIKRLCMFKVIHY